MPTAVLSHKTATIQRLNDTFRRTFAGGKIMTTCGVAEFPVEIKTAAFIAVQTFDAFTEDNDPHGEHDFGSFEIGPRKFFWKIDYYAPDMENGSEDPSDPRQTTRVLTIMLAEDY